MSLIDDIKINSLSEAYEILKGIGVDDNLFEKAHKDGDLHPNGKWVWVSSAAGGKGDWRTLNGRTHKKHTAANAGSASSSAAAGNSSNAGSGSAGKTDGGGNSAVASNKTNSKPATSSQTTVKLTSQSLNDLGDGSSIIIKNRQTGTSHIELTKENGQWYYKDTRRAKQKTTNDNVLRYFNDYSSKKMYRIEEKFVKTKNKTDGGAATEKKTKGVSEKTLSDVLIKECSKDINQSLTDVINNGYSSFDKEIDFNGKKQTIYVELYKKDNIGRKKSYEISVGTRFGNIEKISENTYIGLADIKAAIKSYFKDKQSTTKPTKKTTKDGGKKSDIHIVDMQQSVRDKNSLLKQLKSAKSNKVLIHYHSTSGFDINQMRSIAEKEGWKITDKSVDKNGNHTYDVNSYTMFEKQK